MTKKEKAKFINLIAKVEGSLMQITTHAYATELDKRTFEAMREAGLYVERFRAAMLVHKVDQKHYTFTDNRGRRIPGIDNLD